MKNRKSIHRISDNTLVAQAEAWLLHLRGRGISLRTIHGHRVSIRQLEKFLRREKRAGRVQEISARDLEAWQLELVGRKIKPSSIDSYLQTAKQWFSWLEKNGTVFASPARELRLPKNPRPMQFVPTVQQVMQLLQSIPENTPVRLRDRALIETAYATALRLSELAQVKVSSVDLGEGTVRVIGKGGKERIVPLTKAAVAALGRYLSEARPAMLHERLDRSSLWLSRDGNPLLRGSIREMLRVRGIAARVMISPHAFRRGCATHLLQAGASVAIIKELLDHASYKHMGSYLRYAPEAVIAAHQKAPPGQ